MVPETTLPHAGIFLGDFVKARSCILAVAPLDVSVSSQVRALHLLTGELLVSTVQDYWLVQLGTLKQGNFKILAPEYPLTTGLPLGTSRRVVYDPVLPFSRGDVIVLRVLTHGQPAPLVGLSVCLEYGTLPAGHAKEVVR